MTAVHLGHMAHAVLPYMAHMLKKGKFPPRNKLKRHFQNIVNTFAFENKRKHLHLYESLTPAAKKRLFEMWCYVIDLIWECDEVWIEPSINGLRPDLVVTHRGYVYVIEIKTIHKFISISRLGSSMVDDLKKQAAARAAFLKSVVVNKGDFFAYALFFNTDLEAPFDPIWKQLRLPPLT